MNSVHQSIARWASKCLVVCTALTGLFACAHQDPINRHNCYDQDDRLAKVMNEFSIDDNGCRVDDNHACEFTMHELERLALVCPEHQETRWAAFEISLRRNELDTARRHLSAVQGPPTLRLTMAQARMAVENGNPDHAIAILGEGVSLFPNEAQLYEMLAGAHYVQEHYYEAAQQLKLARKLGAPESRLAYHEALIHEACGRSTEAIQAYDHALELDPEFKTPDARANALRKLDPRLSRVPPGCEKLAANAETSQDARVRLVPAAPPQEPSTPQAPLLETQIVEGVSAPAPGPAEVLDATPDVSAPVSTPPQLPDSPQ